MKHTTERILRILFPVFALVYLVWRIGWTIPADHGVGSVIFSLILLLAELVGILEMMIHFYTVSGGSQKKPPLPQVNAGDLPDVDVFVPTCGEPSELLEQTLLEHGAVAEAVIRREPETARTAMVNHMNTAISPWPPAFRQSSEENDSEKLERNEAL